VDPSSHRRWIAYRQPRSDVRLRLFCFHYAGGGASIFRAWTGKLPHTLEVCPIQLPGRESRIAEPPITRLPRLTAELANVLSPYLTTPFAFFGHSMGALICFELARYLRMYTRFTPSHLFISAHRAPQLPYKDLLSSTLPDAELKENLRQLNGTRQGVLANDELMELMLPILRADLQLGETYCFTSDEPLTCPISVLGGLQDAELSHDDLLAWQEHTSGSFTLRMFEGGHFFLHTAEAALLPMLALELAPYLSQ
jgi:medium-chain acyl-[acyl-carrier-protein] hydrolase